MSYLPTAPFAAHGLGDDEDCILEADASTQGMFAKRQDVAANWNPTGFFSIPQLQLVIDNARQMMIAANGVIEQATNDLQLPSSRSALMAASSELADQERKVIPFQDAIRDALAKNVEVIEAPTLKRFVIGALEVSQAAMFVVAREACRRPWWLDALATFFGVFTAIANAIISVAGVALKVGQTVLKVADNLDTIVIVGLVGGAALGAYWLWSKFGKPAPTSNPARRRRRSRGRR